jgi:hypothetical protein
MAAPIIRKRRETPLVGPMLAKIYAATDGQVFELLAEHAVGPARPIVCERCGTRQHAIRDDRRGLTARFRAVDFKVTMIDSPRRLRPKRGRITVKCRLCRHLTRLPI